MRDYAGRIVVHGVKDRVRLFRFAHGYVIRSAIARRVNAVREQDYGLAPFDPFEFLANHRMDRIVKTRAASRARLADGPDQLVPVAGRLRLDPDVIIE